MIWQEKSYDLSVASLLEEKSAVSPIIAKLLSIRNVSTLLDTSNFLNPKLAHLSDPFEIPQMVRAIERIKQALVNEEPILLIGDYDADGISSVSILQKVLLELGANSAYVIPRRIDEGYGLTMKVLSRGLKENDASLVIALDCGTNSKKEAVFLEKSKIDLIVVDHHKAKDEVSTIPIILNPHLMQESKSPWYNLCTAGLTFKLAHGLIKNLKIQSSPLADKINLRDFLPLCAIGTVADLVPLQHENRIIAKFGLKHLAHNPSEGIKALLNEGKIDRNTCPKSEDITFKLAPMINACGRMDDPTVAISLFLENDSNKCRTLAQQMNQYNEQRKFIEAKLTGEAEKQAKSRFADEPAVIATGSGDWWNPGVVGIVAGKLANSLSKPCLVLAKSDNGEYRGSGRGTKGLDLVMALTACKDLLLHWGGHPVAVGLSIKEDNLKNFTERFITEVSKQIGETPSEPVLEIDSFINLNELEEKLLHEIEKLAPFGQGNPEPIFGIEKVRLHGRPRKVGKGHFQFSIYNGVEAVSGIAWRMGDDIPPDDKDIDIAIRLQWNLWNQRKKLQMVMESWKYH